jgi:hypothetical protein
MDSRRTESKVQQSRRKGRIDGPQTITKNGRAAVEAVSISLRSLPNRAVPQALTNGAVRDCKFFVLDTAMNEACITGAVLRSCEDVFCSPRYRLDIGITRQTARAVRGTFAAAAPRPGVAVWASTG